MAKKGTKKALIASVLSMTLSASMFVGTTFAWFTDSVESGVNTIVAGNLDVELTHKGAGDGNTFTSVKNATNLFKNVNGDPMLWEPGASSTETFRVTNEGTLALKYRFEINYDNATKTPEGKTLADVLTATVKTPDGQTTTSTLADFVYCANLYATQTDEFTVTIAWIPSQNDNDFNVKGGLSIDLGVSVYATQLTYEADGEDDQYDLAAPWTGVIPASLDKTTLEIVPGGGTKTGTITINSAEDFAYLNKLAAEWVSLYSNGQGKDVEKYYPSNGGKGTDYYYYWQWNVNLAADLDMSNIPMNSISTYWDSFNGNGHTISNVVMKDGERGLFQDKLNLKNLTVKNIVVNAPNGSNVGAVVGNRATFENVHVENANIVGGKYVGALAGKGSTFKNCSVKNATVFGNDKTAGGFVGYACGDPNPATVSGNTIEEVTVTGAYNVGGLLGQAQNALVENNIIKNVTVGNTANLPADASPNEVLTAEVAARHAFNGTVIGNNTVENVKMTNVAFATPGNLEEALEIGLKDIVVTKGTYTFPTSKVQAGMTLECDEGTVFEGTSSLNVKGATVVGATFDGDKNSAVSGTIDGTFKNCVFDGYNGLHMCYAGETVVFEDCIFTGDLYGAHFDGGANEVIFRRCTFSGFNAFGAAIEKLTMEDCTFKANGRSGYNGINMWGNTEMTGCTFVFDGSSTYEWIDLCNANKTAEFTNCVVTDGTNVKNFKEEVSKRESTGTVIVDGVVCVSGSTDLKAALSSEDKNVEIFLMEDISIDIGTGWKMGGAETESITIDGNGKTLTLSSTYRSYFNLANANGKLYLNNMTLTNTHAGTHFFDYTTHFNCDVVAKEVTFAKSPLVGSGVTATFTDCVFNQAGNDIYGLWIMSGSNVTVNGGELTTDRGFKITDEDSAAESTVLNVSGTKFNNNKKAAILVTTKHGATITVANVDISNCDADKVNAVWIDEDRTAYADTIKVTGAKCINEP